MELTLWTYEGPPHVGAMRIASSMKDIHYVLHAPQGDTYADLLFTMIERRGQRPPVTYTTFQARDLGGDTAELVKKNIKEAVERFKPKTLLVGESCTAELIQDQPGALAKGMGFDMPIVNLELPAYSKKENWGASETFYQLIRTLLKEKVSLITFVSIVLGMLGVLIILSSSLSIQSSEQYLGNIVALAIPINFSILVMIIRKNKNLDMVPAIFYSGIFSRIYGLILSESFVFTRHDILMGFFLGVPQLAFGFICITIGSRTTPSTTIGLLMLTETLFAPVWVWIFLNEIPPLSVLIGGCVIITAIILKSLDKNKVTS